MLNFFLNRSKKNGVYERTAIGKLAGSLGLLSNLLLFAGKFIIGLSAQSVSIMADAINSLSDTASSILTLIGFRISAKPADSEHPYGHERFEAISGFVVSLIITFVGAQFLISSVQRIMEPTSIRLSPLLFIVLVLSILIKIWQGAMYRKLANLIGSQTLKASGQDSLNDVYTTGAVLFSATIEWLTGLRIDGFVGCLIALYILISGIKMIRSFINELLGARPTQEEVAAMELRLDHYPTILGYHDLLVHNYGPKNRFASVHIEVDETWSLREAHEVIDAIEQDFRQSLKVDLVCHLDPVPIQDQQYRHLKKEVSKIIRFVDPQLRMHDFQVKGDLLAFDLVIPAKPAYSDQEIEEMLKQKIKETLGDYELKLAFDHSYLL